MQNKLKTVDQKRAAIVFKHVKDVERDTEVAKKYGSLALSAPTLIRTAGLVQALAFYEAKGKDHHLKLLDHWTQELKNLGILPKGKENLREYAASDSCGLVEYMRLTREVLALSQWHRRFAQSVLKAKTGGET